MRKAEWYDCKIAVQGNPNKSLSITVNGQRVGSLTISSPVKDEQFTMIVEPGRYDYRVTGSDYKHRPLLWEGTTLANYPVGSTIYLVCN
jgi:hypothetical protein